MGGKQTAGGLTEDDCQVLKHRGSLFGENKKTPEALLKMTTRFKQIWGVTVLEKKTPEALLKMTTRFKNVEDPRSC